MTGDAAKAALLAQIQDRLAALTPTHLELQDESARHAGHAHGGGSHFRLEIVSPAFAGLSTLARHRLVYTALGELLQGPVHALAIKAMTPEEASL